MGPIMHDGAHWLALQACDAGSCLYQASGSTLPGLFNECCSFLLGKVQPYRVLVFYISKNELFPDESFAAYRPEAEKGESAQIFF